MKHIFTILLFLFFLPVPMIQAHDVAAASYDAMVVINVTDFDDATLAKLSAQIGREKNVSLEYACTWSRVAVVKFSDISVGERADVITLMRRLLGAAGVSQDVEFLHVHVEARGVGKC